MNTHEPVQHQPTAVVWMFKNVSTHPAQDGSYCHPPQQQLSVSSWRPMQNIEQWLRIQNRAFNRQNGLQWGKADFHRELASRPWFTESITLLASVGSDPAIPAGTVTLEFPSTDATVARLHWLAVDPEYQRLGIGQSLVSTCERMCHRRGVERIEIETLCSWEAAMAFYEAVGFESIHN